MPRPDFVVDPEVLDTYVPPDGPPPTPRKIAELRSKGRITAAEADELRHVREGWEHNRQRTRGRAGGRGAGRGTSKIETVAIRTAKAKRTIILSMLVVGGSAFVAGSRRGIIGDGDTGSGLDRLLTGPRIVAGTISAAVMLSLLSELAPEVATGLAVTAAAASLTLWGGDVAGGITAAASGRGGLAHDAQATPPGFIGPPTAEQLAAGTNGQSPQVPTNVQ